MTLPGGVVVPAAFLGDHAHTAPSCSDTTGRAVVRTPPSPLTVKRRAWESADGRPGALPIEELLFFVVVPVCAVLTYESVLALRLGGIRPDPAVSVDRG
jgi:hypothetical protein